MKGTGEENPVGLLQKPVCSLVNDKRIESTLYKAPRPSARVLTLRHAPTPRHDIVWAREPLVQQKGAVGLFV